MKIEASFIYPFMKHPVYFFHVLIEKGAMVPDTPSSFLHMISTATKYMILHRQLFHNQCAQNRKENRKDLLRSESTGATKYNLAV